MVQLLLLAAIGVAVLLASQPSEASVGSDYDPMRALKKAVETSSSPPQLPPPSEMSESEQEAWAAFAKKTLGRTSGAAAPEFPFDPNDLGPEGDLNALESPFREEVAYALVHQDDPQALSMIASEVEVRGYPIAANRLRQKAIRIVDIVGSPETSAPAPAGA